MYKLTVEAGGEVVDSFLISDEDASQQPFGVNPVGSLLVNLGARGFHLFAAGNWQRVKVLPVETLKVAS